MGYNTPSVDLGIMKMTRGLHGLAHYLALDREGNKLAALTFLL